MYPYENEIYIHKQIITKHFNDLQTIRHLMQNIDVVRKEYVIFAPEILFNSLRVEQGDMSSRDNFDIHGSYQR